MPLADMQGRPSPLRQWCISPCFRFPLCFRKFSEKCFHFYLPKFLMTFFSHQPQISNFPLFSLFLYIFPLFRKIYSFPLLLKISPLFSANLRVFTYLMCFLFPPTFTMMQRIYVSHNARTGRPCRHAAISKGEKLENKFKIYLGLLNNNCHNPYQKFRTVQQTVEQIYELVLVRPDGSQLFYLLVYVTNGNGIQIFLTHSRLLLTQF